jgi:hypothetical protein
MVELIVELNLETQDSSKVPGNESTVPDNSNMKLKKNILNLSSMINRASLHKSELILLRKYSLRELSEQLIREGFPDSINGCMEEGKLGGPFRLCLCGFDSG